MMHTSKNSSANEGHCDMGQDAAKDRPNPPLPKEGELQFPPFSRGGEEVGLRTNLVWRTVRVSAIILCLSFAASAFFSISAEGRRTISWIRPGGAEITSASPCPNI